MLWDKWIYVCFKERATDLNEKGDINYIFLHIVQSMYFMSISLCEESETIEDDLKGEVSVALVMNVTNGWRRLTEVYRLEINTKFKLPTRLRPWVEITFPLCFILSLISQFSLTWFPRLSVCDERLPTSKTMKKRKKKWQRSKGIKQIYANTSTILASSSMRG